MTSLLEFFYDGRKLFITIILTLLFLIVFFVFKKEIIPYNVFWLLFSKYFGEIHPIAFLFFYYFIVSYIISIIIVGFYDFVRRKRRLENA